MLRYPEKPLSLLLAGAFYAGMVTVVHGQVLPEPPPVINGSDAPQTTPQAAPPSQIDPLRPGTGIDLEAEPREVRNDTSSKPREVAGDRADRFEPQVPPPDPRLVVPETEPQPEAEPYRALGLKTGAVIWRPAIAVEGVVSDNVRQTKQSKREDIGVRIIPELAIETDWLRHAFTFTGTGTFLYWGSQSDFDTTEAAVSAALRLDVRSTTTWELLAGYTLADTPSSDNSVPNGAVGGRLDQTITASSILTHRMGRLSAALTAGFSYNLFGDVDLQGGGTQTNEDRDYVEGQARLRLSYETSPAISPYIEAGYTPRIHDKAVDRNGLKRDSHGYEVSAGVVFAPDTIWSGELGLRYSLRDYDDASLETVDGFGVTGRVEWRPSALTTLRLTANTGIEESDDPAVSGSRVNAGRIEIDHLLRDNIRVSAGFGVEFTDMAGPGQDEVQYRGVLSLSYFIRRGFELTAAYNFDNLDSDVPGSGYTENRVTAGFRYSF